MIVFADFSVENPHTSLPLIGNFNLRIPSLNIEPETPQTNQNTTIKFEIENSGTETITNFTWKLDTEEETINGYYPGFLNNQQTNYDIQTRFNTPGNHTIKLTLDPANKFTETNESDNEKIILVKVNGSDSIDDPANISNSSSTNISNSTNSTDSSENNESIDDNEPPSVNPVEIAGAYSINQPVVLEAFATDNVGISSAFARIRIPTSKEVTVLLNKANDRFKGVFNQTTAIGKYTVAYIVTDSSENVNSSVSVYFNVNDVEKPKIADFVISPSAGKAGSSFVLQADVTDNVKVQKVEAIVKGPKSSKKMGLVKTKTYYSGVFVHSKKQPTGKYEVSLTAVDSSDNKKEAQGKFTVKKS